jgi:CBS domain-containing protein
MTKDLVSAVPDTSLKELVKRVMDFEVSSLPVVDDGGSLVGIVTEADLMSKEAYGGRRRRALALLADALSGRGRRWVVKAAGTTASEVMTTKVITCRPDDDVRVVARRMLEQRVKRLPVVESGRLVGMVSRQDILSMFDRPDEDIEFDVRRLLGKGLNMPEGHHVRFSVDQGIVTLTGDARYAWGEPIVVSMVRGIEGVIDVVSRLHHREPNPRTSTAPWIFGRR